MTIMAPEEFWTAHVIDGPWATAEASLAALTTRNERYPGAPELLPVTYPGKDVLDYGCGPGHDVLGLLLDGARHVYAADISPPALSVTRARLELHGLTDRATMLQLPTELPPVDHAICAGVLHHVTDPVRVLREITAALRPGAELRLMVYSSESWWYRVHCQGDPAVYSAQADGASPLNRAWSRAEVQTIAAEAGATALYLGSYRVPGEPEGPGLSACYSLQPRVIADRAKAVAA